jgi:hypothetical protein
MAFVISRASYPNPARSRSVWAGFSEDHNIHLLSFYDLILSINT